MKKKAILCFLLAALCLWSPLSAFADGVPGDVDGDGSVTAADARIILRFAVLLEAPTTSQRKLSDLDDDGKISASDARFALRRAVGLDLDFESLLYSYSHQFDRLTADELPKVDNWIENGYRSVGKWCCYYTVHDVFRPVLKKAGYSDERIDQLAPNSYEPEKVNLALKNATSISLPIILRPLFFGTSRSIYIPSLLADYYRTHPQYAATYNFYPYFDDILGQGVIAPSANRAAYVPKVGDILFASNKTSTYVEGYPTIDHTAQIIRVNPDGSFLCTDGCILFNDGTDKPRVCEREYVFNAERGVYEYKYNSVVVVLMIARPAL